MFDLKISCASILIVIFLAGCGIENSMYFQEPRNVVSYIKGSVNPITTAGTDKAAIKFYGYNQEKDNSNNLFVGYDIYYYFQSSPYKRKANVQYPVVPTNAYLLPFPNVVSDPPARFLAASFPSSMSNFFEIVSYPVTSLMIDNYLKQGSNDNVRFTFENKDIADINVYPMIGGISGEAGSYIYLRSIFPAYYEYNGKNWGSLDTDFAGFYDIDYYNAISIAPFSGIADGSVDCVYLVYFYIVAKGFNSDVERSQNFIESIPSSTVEVYFKAAAASKNH